MEKEQVLLQRPDGSRNLRREATSRRTELASFKLYLLIPDDHVVQKIFVNLDVQIGSIGSE